MTIVAIDEHTLARLGQWPWPRTRLAELLEHIAAARPTAIGFDLLLPESDRYSPDAMARLLPQLPAELASRLSELPTNDARLAQAMRGRNVVLASAGLEEPDARYPGPPRAAPVRFAPGFDPPLRQFEGRLSNIEALGATAAGHGLISADIKQRIVRRVPLVARVSGVVMPGLALEMLRVATGEPTLRLAPAAGGLMEVSFGDVRIPAQADGSAWLRFSPHDASRFVSAAAVLDGTADPALLRSKLVLLGVTGLGLLDYKATPLGESVPGVELHAQLIEQIFDGAFLVRPGWANLAEAALLAAGILLLMLVVPHRSVVASAAALFTLLASALALGLGAFLYAGMLVDPSWPALGMLLAFAVLLAVTYAEADRQRRQLREEAARAAGELAAARRIQMGLLPDLGALSRSPSRLELAAVLEPARTVGGDFYDCLMLDADRLYFVIGDVSGKGMPAALFMALSKAILKAAAARAGTDVGAIMTRASAEIARDNPEQLFVTAFAGIIDLRSGVLEYSNAGHEPPYLCAAHGALERFPHAGGPPLCTLDGFAYRTAHRRLESGDCLCMVSDGVTEAMNERLELYGAQRLGAVLGAALPGAPASGIVAAVRQDVQRFVGAALASDDLTLLALRWSALANGDLDAPVAGLFHPVRGRY